MFIFETRYPVSGYTKFGCTVYTVSDRDWPCGGGGGLAGGDASDSASTSMSGLAARRHAVSPGQHAGWVSSEWVPAFSLTGTYV